MLGCVQCLKKKYLKNQLQMRWRQEKETCWMVFVIILKYCIVYKIACFWFDTLFPDFKNEY